jgi:HEPN domain-containing protein
MPAEDPLAPPNWVRIAEKDLKRVELGLANDDPGLAGFYLQQALEKLLKAFLLGKGWKLRKIHDLETLIEDAIQFDPNLKSFQDPCDKITEFYMVDRYPSPMRVEPSGQEVRHALEAVRGLIEILRKA